MAFSVHTIEPLDTVFFRDGRPFAAGEGTDAYSLFPPAPMTMQGLIRSKLLSRGCSEGFFVYKKGCVTGKCPRNSSCEAKRVVGSVQPDDKNGGTLQLRGPWLMVCGALLLPVPGDLIALTEKGGEGKREEHKSRETRILSPKANGTSVSNLPGTLCSLDPPSEWKGKEFGVVSGWITWDAFKKYLMGNPPILEPGRNWWQALDLWGEELRPGLEIEDCRNRAQEGQLYFARHIRLKQGVSLACELDGLDGMSAHVQETWLSPFGGERRAVAITPLGANSVPWRQCDEHLTKKIEETGQIKLVLTQPAWFANGWYPNGWNPDTREAVLNGTHGTKATWLAAQVGRAEVVGGWDLARGDQKPVRRFVPARSVYYLQVDPSQTQALLSWSNLWNTCLPEFPDGEPFTFQSLGLGHVLIGTW